MSPYMIEAMTEETQGIPTHVEDDFDKLWNSIPKRQPGEVGHYRDYLPFHKRILFDLGFLWDQKGFRWRW